MKNISANRIISAPSLKLQLWCAGPLSPKGYWQCGKSKSKSSKVRVGWHRQQSSVSVMTEKLKWPTLEHRRKNLRLTTMFKIVHGLVAVPTTSLIPADSRTMCNHQYKFKCILVSTSAYIILFTTNNPPVEQPWQRICRGDFHRLLQESPSLVRRRHSSTWYPASGVCRLRSRSRSRFQSNRTCRKLCKCDLLSAHA